ncbi:MAG: ParB N-terminal domain-containing protein [Candidatus Thorarchaeota archaeon]
MGETGKTDWTKARLEVVPLSQLKPSPYNPSSRTEKRRLEALRKSIENYGLLYPILVNSQFEIIDGHRRATTVELLGWNAIPAIILNGDISVDEAYLEVATTVKRPRGSEWTERFAQGGNVPRRHERAIECVSEWCGSDYIHKLVKRHLSATSIVTVARRVAAYCDVPISDKEFMDKVMRWLVEGRRSNLARRLTDTSTIDPDVLFRAVIENRDVRLTAELSD